MHKKSLEICCYVAGSGAFGVFFRWLQTQVAFNELGLADKSVLNWIVVLYVITVAVVFTRFVNKLRKQRYFVPDEFCAALANPGKLFTGLRWAAGVIMSLGGIVLLATCETHPEAKLLRIVALLAIVSGLCFPPALGSANRKSYNPTTVCFLFIMPVFMYAMWLITTYKTNDINGALWSYGPEIIAVSVAMIAFFRMAGFIFDTPDWRKSLFYSMFACSLCVLSLADERNLGLQIIFLASAAMLLIYIWVMVMNLQRFEEAPKVYPDDGFDRL